jgi:hypothetical protein
MRVASTVCLVLLFALPVSGQSKPQVVAPILQGAAMPMYPPIAEAAHIVGKVIMRITVANGSVANAEVVSVNDGRAGQRYLEIPTKENLKTWRFAADVNGIFTVSYTYRISGTETDEPTNSTVVIHPSLDVEVTARPVKPRMTY